MTIITFDNMSTSGTASGYTEQGYVFNNSPKAGNNGSAPFFVAANSGYNPTSNSFFENTRGDPSTSFGEMTAIEGGSFTVSQIDVDSLFSPAGGAVTETFIGYRLDGSTVQQNFTLDTSQGFQTVTLNNFTNLVAFDWNAGSGFPYAVIDNVNVVCFCDGTMISTAHGDTAVEALTVGDLVVTSSGEHRPIRWLGKRRTDCRNHPRPQEVMPVRILAHAFGRDRPSRDLWVSPAHAVCVDVLGEVLIPASSLINGTTVQQVDVDSVTYWHVELDSHDVILAENLPTESYIEMGNRTFFEESSVVALQASPDAPIDAYSRTHADFCRPFHVNGPVVAAVRQQLRTRALAAGWALDATEVFAGLYLLVDGVRIDPVTRGLAARFLVPGAASDVWLVSGSMRPSAVDDSADNRDLGVPIKSLSVSDGFTEGESIDLADPRLCVGFHDMEEGVRRWTSGRACLPADLWDHRSDAFFLKVELAGPALPQWRLAGAYSLTTIGVYPPHGMARPGASRV